MTTSNLAFNPILTTVAQGSFNVDTVGFIQGTALDQPAIRNSLAGGFLASSETLPMWGGVGISEAIPGVANTPASVLGGPVTRATSVTAAAALSLTGFSVFDQAHAMVNNPQSPVPLAATFMQVNFYRLGSGARIAVAVAPSLVSLEGSIITSQVSWDFNGQQLVPFVAAYPANVLTALTRALVTGFYIATATTTTNHGVAVGDYFTITGEAPAAYNGVHIAIAGTATNQLVWNTGLTVDPGASTVQGTLVAGGGALPCDVLDFNFGGSMTVSYDLATGFATWNRSGNCAIIQI